jgi:hypothetical protein
MLSPQTMFYISNKARAVVLFGQYTTVRAVLTHNVECLDTALSRGILAIYHKVPYYYYKLVTNIIRAVKINVLSYLLYTV